MILWTNIENCPFYHFESDPRFPPFLLYVRWKSGVTFVRRYFRDEIFDFAGKIDIQAEEPGIRQNIERQKREATFKVPLHTWAIYGQFRHVFHTLSQQN